MDKHKDILKFLTGSGSINQKTIILKALNADQARAVSEVVVNMMYGVLPITRHYKRSLKQFKPLWLNIESSTDIKRASIISKNTSIIILMLYAVSRNLRKVI
jgi:HrpA-like RNA helicase